MADQIHVAIDQNSIQAIIQAHVQTAVAQALLPHSERFVREIVTQTLCSKSKDSAYQYTREEQRPTVLEHFVRTIIADEASRGIREWAESNRPKIATSIRKAIASADFADRWATQLVEGMMKATTYGFRVEVNPQIKEH